MSNYNSFTAPENNFEVKKVINQINEHKRLNYQKHRYSSFETAEKGVGKETSNNSNFYLNKERTSLPLATHLNEIVTVENDWQEPSTIPYLENGLDVILKNPGIYPI